jgi:hypothetical protein
MSLLETVLLDLLEEPDRTGDRLLQLQCTDRLAPVAGMYLPWGENKLSGAAQDILKHRHGSPRHRNAGGTSMK